MVSRIDDGVYRTQVRDRHSRGERMRIFYLVSIVIAFLTLIILLYNVVNQAFGLVAVSLVVTEDDLIAELAATVPEGETAGENLVDYSETELLNIIFNRAPDIPFQLIISNIIDRGVVTDLTRINDFPLAEIVRDDAELPEEWTPRLEDIGTLSDTQEAEVGAFLDGIYGGLNAQLPEDEDALRDLTGITGISTITGLLEIPEDWENSFSEPLNETQLSIIRNQFINASALRILIGEQMVEGDAETLSPPSNWPDLLRYDNSLRFEDLTTSERNDLLALNLSKEQIIAVIDDEVILEEINESWNLNESIFDRAAIDARVEDRYPDAELQWKSWLTANFITNRLTDDVETTGIRAPLLGSILLMVVVIVVSFPLGVGAAIYLEEYAEDTVLNRLIETNIRNLAGVPSIIYGMLGLAIFVRSLEDVTGGRTVLSGGLTLTLLILPIIIIQSQEALRGVPNMIREGSYGLGATKWQTISKNVLPVALPGILTGTIIALSRAVGETAPLIVVGAATFIAVDPNFTGSFSALPIIIYNWTLRPEPEFQNAAGAAIILLLILLLTMNSIAIIIRNRTTQRN